MKANKEEQRNGVCFLAIESTKALEIYGHIFVVYGEYYMFPTSMFIKDVRHNEIIPIRYRLIELLRLICLQGHERRRITK